jgi:hypothetical protein
MVFTAFHGACLHGYSDIVKYFKEDCSVDINLTTNDGATGLDARLPRWTNGSGQVFGRTIGKNVKNTKGLKECWKRKEKKKKKRELMKQRVGSAKGTL